MATTDWIICKETNAHTLPLDTMTAGSYTLDQKKEMSKAINIEANDLDTKQHCDLIKDPFIFYYLEGEGEMVLHLLSLLKGICTMHF
jgi:hypothetical protein